MQLFKEIIWATKAAAVLSVISIGCSYKIGNSDPGYPVMGKKMSYKFTEKPGLEVFSKIDTAALYMQVFEGRYYNDTEKQNPEIIIFYSDGFFEQTLPRLYDKNKEPDRRSLYGGRYKVNGNVLQTESFTPSRGGNTKYWNRFFQKAKIEGDRIIFAETNHSSLSVYKKQKK